MKRIVYPGREGMGRTTSSMENLIVGILTLLICFVGYLFSWRYQRKQEYVIAVVLLVLCGFILRVFTSADLYLHTWDERFHALVAKHLIEHPLLPTLYDQPVLPYDFRNWTANHIWLHKQPLPLWTMACSMKLFGVNELALRVPSILISTTGIWLMYRIGAELWNRRTGYLAAFLFSVNGLIIELTAGRVPTDHIDVFFLFFTELSVFFSILYAKRTKIFYTLLAGCSLGAAILSKWLPALVVLPLWILIVYQYDRISVRRMIIPFLILAGVATLVFLPWQLYIHHSFPVEAAWEAQFNRRHLTEVLEGLGGPPWYFLNKIRINYGELIYLPLAWFIWITVKHRDLKRLSILTWFLVPFLFFSFARTKMQGYLVFTAPALFIMTADFFCWLGEKKKKGKAAWLPGLIQVLLIVLPVRYAIERIKPFSVRERNPEWVQELRKLDNRGIVNGVLFNYEKPVEAMFYTDLTVYPGFPGRELVRELLDKGMHVLIYNDGTVPPELAEIDNVILIPGQAPDTHN